jgi:hypothetical protein
MNGKRILVEDLHLLAAEHARHTTKPLARRTLRVPYFST